MRVEDTTERDAQWEEHAESFRVCFWTIVSEAKVPGTVPLWSSECKRLIGVADVREALAWAEENAGGRLFTLFAEIPIGTDKAPGLVRIGGTDPTFD